MLAVRSGSFMTAELTGEAMAQGIHFGFGLASAGSGAGGLLCVGDIREELGIGELSFSVDTKFSFRWSRGVPPAPGINMPSRTYPTR